MARTFGFDSPAGLLGILGAGLWGAVMALLVVLFVPVICHELGHLAAGAVVGFRPRHIVIGPWGWQHEGGGWRFYWTGGWLEFGGLAGADVGPTPLKWRTAVYTLGGPLMSLILAVPGASKGYYLAILRPILHTPLPPPNAGIATVLVCAWGFVAALGFIFSMVPLRTGPLRGDGPCLWLIARGGPPARRYAAVAALATDLQLGGAPEGWPSNWIEDASCVSDGSADDAYGCYYAYLWNMARRDYTAAGKMIGRCLEGAVSLPADYQLHVYLEAANYVISVEGDPSRARKLFDLGRNSPLDSRERVSAIEARIYELENRD